MKPTHAKNCGICIYWLFAMLYWEILSHCAIYAQLQYSFLYAVCFSASLGLIISFLMSFLPKKAEFWLSLVLSVGLIFLYGSQMVYFFIFQSPYSITQVGMGADAMTHFWRETAQCIKNNFLWILALLLPCVLLIVLYRLDALQKASRKFRIVLLVDALLIPALTYGCIRAGGTEMYSDHYFFADAASTTSQTMERFGLPTTVILEMVRQEEEEDLFVPTLAMPTMPVMPSMPATEPQVPAATVPTETEATTEATEAAIEETAVKEEIVPEAATESTVEAIPETTAEPVEETVTVPETIPEVTEEAIPAETAAPKTPKTQKRVSISKPSVSAAVSEGTATSNPVPAGTEYIFHEKTITTKRISPRTSGTISEETAAAPTEIRIRTEKVTLSADSNSDATADPVQKTPKVRKRVITDVSSAESEQPEEVTEPEAVPEEVTEPETIPEEVTEPESIPEEVTEPETVPEEVTEPESIPEEVTEPESIPEEVTEPESIPEEVTEPESIPEEVTEPETIPEEVTEPETVPEEVAEPESIPEEVTEPESIPEEVTEPETIPEEVTEPESIPEEVTEPESIPEEVTEPESIPEEATEPETIPEEVTEPETIPEETIPEGPPVYNVLDLDLEAMAAAEKTKHVAALHQYFSQVPPTKQNKYTGAFRDYNLIVICAESFSPAALDPEVTPTLYKMAHQGFVFNNYFNSFLNTTINGEFALTQGLFPDPTCDKYNSSMRATMKNALPFTLGNAFAQQRGITSRGYHNYVGDYYSRKLTHPNMGYDMKFSGSGLTLTNSWPASDLEMMEQSVDDYIHDSQFSVYYMTFSGHYRYSRDENAIARKNFDAVKDLPNYNMTQKSYLACHIELDKALEYLLQRLEEEGIAERTAIVIASDHYPYGMQESDYFAMLNKPNDKLEQYRSSLIFWVGGMEPVEVNEYCCNVDILPTLLNMWGFDYDSRMLSGTDIFSDSLHAAIFLNHSFVNEFVYFDANRRQVRYFVDESLIPAGYVDYLNQLFYTRFEVAKQIVRYNYYASLPAYSS